MQTTSWPILRAVTNIKDARLCLEILEAHGWDLETAIFAITTATSGAALSALVAFVDEAGSSDQGCKSVSSIEKSSSTRLSI